MTNPATSSENGERTCPRCGAHFVCGTEAGHDRCWCFDLPHVMPLHSAEYNGCLCPQCLRELIAARQHEEP